MKKLCLMLVCIFMISSMVSAAEVVVQQPFVITSVGQSPDGQMVKVLANRLGLDFEYDNLVGVEDLDNYKAIFLVVGGSSKGLGAAGIDIAGELQRTSDLLQKSKEKDVVLVGVHLGGMARRGSLSNQFVEAVFPNVDLMIVVEDGNEDGYFTKVAEKIKIKLYSIDRVLDMTAVLEEIVAN